LNFNIFIAFSSNFGRHRKEMGKASERALLKVTCRWRKLCDTKQNSGKLQ